MPSIVNHRLQGYHHPKGGYGLENDGMEARAHGLVQSKI